MAAELHHEALHGRGAAGSDPAPDLCRACKAYDTHALIVAESIGNGFSLTRDDVENTRGQAGALRQLGQGEGRKGSVRGGVSHDCAAGSKGGRSLPRQHGRWEVPWREQRGDTQCFAAHQHLCTREMAGHALDIEALGLFGVPFHEGSRIGDLPERLGQGLALLERHEKGEILAGFKNEIMPGPQAGGALLRQQHFPGGQGKGRGVDCLRCFIRAKPGDAGNDQSRSRIADLEAGIGYRSGPAAVDIGHLAQQAGIPQPA